MPGRPHAAHGPSPGGFLLQLFHLPLEHLVGLREGGRLLLVELQRLQKKGSGSEEAEPCGLAA